MNSPRSFQTELYKVSFATSTNNGENAMVIEHKRTESYQEFTKLESLGAWLDEHDYALSKYEAAKILEKAVRWFWS